MARRGICPECGREYHLTGAGVMRQHLGGEVGKLWRPNCDGVGKPPKSAVADPVAAALDLGRAAGWREAIEALRDDNRFEAWACDLPADEYARYDKAVSVSFDAILAYLESLAPKETP